MKTNFSILLAGLCLSSVSFAATSGFSAAPASGAPSTASTGFSASSANDKTPSKPANKPTAKHEHKQKKNNEGFDAKPASGYNVKNHNSGFSADPASGYSVKEHHRRRDRDRFSVTITTPDFSGGASYAPDFNGPYVAPVPPYYGPPAPAFYEPRWIDMVRGYGLPEDAVESGGEYNPPRSFYVCRGYYAGGMHPGKWVSGRCNIGWGGNEISLTRYQVLVSRAPLNWIAAGYGTIPPTAIVGGFEYGRPLYVCQAQYRNGMHTGKIVGKTCHIGWGGREINIPWYNVLVR